MESFHTLLFEIGTENLPSKMLRIFGESLFNNIGKGFNSFNIAYEKVIWFASPRRLAVQVINICIKKSDWVVSDLSENNIYAQKHCSMNYNKNFFDLIQSIISDSLMSLPISTMMFWKGKNIRFVRPVRTVTVLLDSEIILCDLFGILSDRVIRGHRFMGHKQIILDHAINYSKILMKQGYVIANYKLRKKIISFRLKKIAKKIGGIIDLNSNLLEEVTSLVEWPIVLCMAFHDRFLSLPYEILLYLIQIKQKYFPVYDANKKLLPYVVFVVDIVSENVDKIIQGHKKVLHYLLSDAEFVLNSDKKYTLEDYFPRLHAVLFHKNLGSLYDKTIRIQSLSSWLALKIGLDENQVQRAAMLAKCDLMSHVVREFPFAQGVIGMYYAGRDGEDEVVALAQKEQYLPKFFSDILPSTCLSCILSVVDKIDTISGMFIIGEWLKGSGDPLGLRRAAIGILRIILEKKIQVNLYELIQESIRLYRNYVCVSEDVLDKILSFMRKRLCVVFRRYGYREDVIRCIMNNNYIMVDIIDCYLRIQAVSSFCKLRESCRLFSMYKRISNILKKIPDDVLNLKINSSLFLCSEEHALTSTFSIVCKKFSYACKQKNYQDALILLTILCDPVDTFFRSVMIMSTDKDVRLNRLSLLANIHHLCSEIIDIALLEV